MTQKLRTIRRLANKAGLELRKHRGQIELDTSWDLLDLETGGLVFGGPARGYYGVGLDEVEAYLRATM